MKTDFKIGQIVYHTKQEEGKFSIFKATILEITQKHDGTFITTQREDVDCIRRTYHPRMIYETFEQAKNVILDAHVSNLKDALSLSEE